MKTELWLHSKVARNYGYAHCSKLEKVHYIHNTYIRVCGSLKR